jgi:16S rRNA (guanine966-N2)-methyltransferase
MRVIAGRLGGRQFQSPGSYRTHPMSEKMRGALFAVLGDITGLTVLDGFAGSGAISWEAVSRGAASSLAVDNDRQAQAVLADNCHQLGLESSVQIVKSGLTSWSRANPGVQFDLIVCDPPYDKPQYEALERLVRHLKPAGTYVVSFPGHLELPRLAGLAIVSHKSYGDAQLVFYQKTG